MRLIRRGRSLIKFRIGRRIYRYTRITRRVQIYFRGRFYRPKRFGRRWRIRVGRRRCRVIRRGRRWLVRYRRRWVSTWKFKIRIGHGYRTVTRRGRLYTVRYKRRTVKFYFRRSLYFKIGRKRVLVRRVRRRGRRGNYFRFRFKGRITKRKIRYRRRRSLRCESKIGQFKWF